MALPPWLTYQGPSIYGQDFPALTQDFMENNWDSLYGSFLPKSGGFQFMNFLRGRRNAYQDAYQGELGSQIMGDGQIPSLTGGDFLSHIFGPQGPSNPALYDYLTTSPFERSGGAQRGSRVLPGRFR